LDVILSFARHADFKLEDLGRADAVAGSVPADRH
jgi:hypothetical protein